MKSTSYYNIQGWMINELGLKANNLIMFAIIYGFSQDGESEFTGSLKYLQGCMGVAKNTALAAIDYLLEQKYIVKQSVVHNSITFNKYKYNEPVVQKLVQGGAISALHPGSNFGINNTILDNTENSNNFNKDGWLGWFRGLEKKERREVIASMGLQLGDPSRVLFVDSKWSDYKTLRLHLGTDKKFVEKFAGVDLQYYIDKADTWSETGNEGNGVYRTDRGWLKTLRDWMTDALRKNELVKLPPKDNQTGFHNH